MNDSYAIVTGASSGIGLEFARLFAADGINLVLVARDKAGLDIIGKELAAHGVLVTVYAADLSDIEQVKATHAFISEQKIKVQYLINCAGFGNYGEFIKTSWAKEQSMIQLNITALTYLTKVYAQEFSKAGSGHIVNVASTAAFLPGPLMAVYYATKAYVLHFSEGVATELKGSGVKVLALCPGPTVSKFQEVAAQTESKLIKGRKLPGSAEVAKFGYKAMMQGRVVAVHGAGNRRNLHVLKLLPRHIVRTMSYRAQSRSQQ
jgi:short-subunit dehydrogenase